MGLNFGIEFGRTRVHDDIDMIKKLTQLKLII